MWGLHAIFDVKQGNRQFVTSGDFLAMFSKKLVQLIDMEAFGPPILEHFAEHVPDAAGFSLVQLIETSAITGHFCDLTGDFYLDIFSCKTFDPLKVKNFLQNEFTPKTIRMTIIER